MKKTDWLPTFCLLILFIFTLSPAGAADKPTLFSWAAGRIANLVTPGPAEAAGPGAPWEAQWEKTVAAAKKEGKVVIYSSGGKETQTAFGDGLKKNFGIETDWVGGRGPALSEKIMRERSAGLHIADVVIGASQPALMTLKPAGALQKLEGELILPEVIDPKAWLYGEFPWLDKDRYILAFMAYPDTTYIMNTNMVPPSELTSFKDLLDPKWKGKIVMDDPTFPGSGGAFFIGISKIMGLDFMRQLVKQEPVLTRNRRLLVEWVARGKYAIGLAPHTPFLAGFQNAGAPLAIGRAKEGSYFNSGIGILSLMKEAPHPNAARVFANWILTKEAQIAHAKITQQQSYRDDIPIDYLAPIRRRDPDIKYTRLVTEEYLQNYRSNLKLSKEIFEPLKK
ncbi:MAG: extracellular solute-binding protein [Desulfobacterales bacterium]|nr:extracellular solute-binding protein [Desulfobacterales bacterium]